MLARFLFAAGIALVLLSGGVVQAGPAYTFEFDQNSSAGGTGTTPGNSFSVGVGQSITLSVYLLEKDSSGSLSTYGLASAGVVLNTSGSVYAPITAANPNNQGANTNSFDQSSGSFSNGGATGQISEYTFVNNAVTPTTGDTETRVLLGSFTFTGTVAGTQITVAATPGTGQDNVLGNGMDIDQYISQSSVVISVNAVPEPGTLILTGALALGLAGGFAHRRWASAVAIA